MIEQRAGWSKKSYLLVFCVTLFFSLGIILAVTSRVDGLAARPVSFYDMTENEAVVTADLTRRQAAALKLRFLESAEPPRIGVFANHMFQFFRYDEAKGSRREFFNYWYANLSLPELRDVLRYAEKIGRLPKETIVVQITTPNNDNGMYILGYRGELPFELMAVTDTSSFTDSLEKIQEIWSGILAEAYYRLSYSSFLAGIASFRRDDFADRIVNEPECAGRSIADATPPGGIGLMRFLPVTVRLMLLSTAERSTYNRAVFCNRERLKNAIKPDGSTEAAYIGGELVRNENPLGAIGRNINQRVLQAGDEDDIERVMRDIDAIGKRNNRRVAFVVPPVYETERPSPVDTVLTRALQRVTDLSVLDHRHLRDDPSLFVHYDHPSSAYFRILVRDMVRAGWLAPADGKAAEVPNKSSR
jgi:hypothetical protein